MIAGCSWPCSWSAPADLGAMLAVSGALWLGAAARPLLGRTAGALLVGSYAAYLIWRIAF